MDIKPDNVNPVWSQNDIWTQALLIAYSQVREYEESESRGSCPMI